METTGVDTRQAQSLEIRLTQVELVYEQGVRNYRLLFGRPFKVITQERTYGRMTKQLALFKPGDVFALDLWDCGPYGTKEWSVFVLQAVAPGDVAHPVPQVSPAAKILLEARGITKAKQAIKELQEIQDRVDPTTLPAGRFLLTDFRLKADGKGRPRLRH